MNVGKVVYSTRGFYLSGALISILLLKYSTGSQLAAPIFWALVAIVGATQVFRTWAAGFVGTAARQRDVQVDQLLTAGPYAHVRNPMYLGNLIIVTGLAAMSGLWYALPVVWLVFGFVYAIVIPYEEAYLEETFGPEYQAYRKAVPRLVPSPRTYDKQHGVFRLREGLANEAAALPGVVIMAALFYIL